MRSLETKRDNELTAADVHKGDLITVVIPYNFHRGYERTGNSKMRKQWDVDIYTTEVWEVAAIGKKIMRLVRRGGGETFKQNIYLMARADGPVCFQSFIASLGNGNALAHELHRTDEFARPEIKVLSTARALELSREYWGS